MTSFSKLSIVGFIFAGLSGISVGCAPSNKQLNKPVTVSFDSPLNLIVVQAKINDRGPFRFFLDSGATSTILDTEAARQVGLKLGPTSTSQGTTAGSKVTFAPIRGGVGFQITPGFTIQVGQVIAAPFNQTSKIMAGEDCHGILGAAVFFQYILKVDYALNTLTFHNPASYGFSGQGTVLDLNFSPGNGRLPFINGTLVNGQRRLENFPVLVDSGGQTMGTVSVAKRNEWDALIDPTNRIVESLGATGLSNDAEGTTHASFATRMERFEMGPYSFENPRVSYSARGSNLAVMGATLLHRFTVVFDYSRKKLILQPNANFAKPLKEDHSGLFFALTADGNDHFKVLFVAGGTPAAQAGMKRGDLIQSINGVPTGGIGLNRARMMLCELETFSMMVLREGRIRQVTIKTRPLFAD